MSKSLSSSFLFSVKFKDVLMPPPLPFQPKFKFTDILNIKFFDQISKCCSLLYLLLSRGARQWQSL